MVGETQRGPQNPHGVLGTPKSSGRHMRHKFQPLEMEELPNLKVSPKPRGNQTMEKAEVSVFGGPQIPEELEKHMGIISQGKGS